MSVYFAILSNIGIQKVIASWPGGPAVNITQFAVGDSNGVYYDPTGAEAALVHETWRAAVNRVYVHPNNPTWMIVEAIIPASAGGFDIREAAAFDGAGALIAIGKYPLTNKPAPGSGADKDIYARLIFQLANTAAIEQTIDSSLVMATQEYVDARVPRPVRVAAAGNVNAFGIQNVDGIDLVVNDRVLLPAQADPTLNGIYLVQAGAWLRTVDADSSLEVTADMLVLVSEGTVNANTVWLLTTAAPIILGTTAIAFTKIFPDEASRTITDANAPTGNSAAPTIMFGWLANMIKSITGKGSWRTAPATTLEAAKAHSDADAPHAGHVNHSLATAANDFLVASGAGVFVKKTLAQVKTILGLGDAAYKNTGTAAGQVAAGDHSHANGAGIGGTYLLGVGGIKRGVVYANGTIAGGTVDFTVNKIGTGVYVISWVTPTAGLPTVIVSAIPATDIYGYNLNTGARADLSSRTGTSVTIYTGQITSFGDHEPLAPADEAFDFIIIG